MARSSSIDYATITKRGFALGIGLFAAGVLGEVVGRTVFGGIPAWESMVFVDLEILGILLSLLVPFIFGLVLPLTE